MREITGNFSRPDVPLPIPVTEDTLYRNCNFSQPTPHTAIFSVLPGVAVEFEDCNGVNVTAPDGAVIRGGNWRHLVRVTLTGQDKPATNLLCECAKCCTYLGLLRDRIASGSFPKDASGRVVHSDLKTAARARRGDVAALTADRTLAASENAAALTKYGRTVTAALQTSVSRGA